MENLVLYCLKTIHVRFGTFAPVGVFVHIQRNIS